MPTVSCLIVFCIACAAGSAVTGGPGNLPGPADVREIAALADAEFAAFMRETMEIRLAYLYGGGFAADAQRTQMTALAQNASAELLRIGRRQEQIRAAIEAYEGPDWDSLYGRTNMWRGIYADCQESTLRRCRIDLYAAMAADDARRIQTAREVLNRLEELKDNPGARLVYAEALWLTGGRDEQARAEKAVDDVLTHPHLDESLRCRALLLRLRLVGRISAADFQQIADALDTGPCADDFELNMQAALLELRLNRPERGALLARTAAKWPKAQAALGRAILAWLESQLAAGKLDAETLNRRTTAEVSLALKAAHDSDPPRYRPLLETLCAGERFASPLAFFVCAEACRPSEPALAIRYYTQAATVRAQQTGDDIPVEAPEVARRAAQLAYKLYFEDSRYLDSARLALEFYCRTAGDAVDEQLEYLCAKVLHDAGRTEQWRTLSEKIAAKGGAFSPDARLDLIAARLQEQNDPLAVAVAAGQLDQLIASLDNRSQHHAALESDAVALYCKLLLERSGPGDLQKALQMLERTSAGAWTLRILRAVALDKAGRTDEAVGVLADALDVLTCDAAEAVSAILVQAVDRIELYQARADDSGLLADRCLRLAVFCVDCARPQDRGQAQLLRAEIALASNRSDIRPSDVEQVLNDLADHYAADAPWRRCRARLLLARGDCEQAFAAWAELRESLEPQAAEPGPPWPWWQAKYYELLCFLRTAENNRAKVIHAVDVLKGTFPDIPSPWAEMLVALKKAPVDQPLSHTGAARPSS